MLLILLILTTFINLCVSRDFYVGMFKQNDFLVAQDVLYKDRAPYRKVIAKYGRIFECPITYFRVADRLGIGMGPHVQIIRGGLQTKYLVLRITSMYNYPISVNVYVGCENKMSRTKSSKVSSKNIVVTTSSSATLANNSGSTATRPQKPNENDKKNTTAPESDTNGDTTTTA